MSPNVLVLEPFNGGSHKQMMDLLIFEFSTNIDFFGLPAKKWHWRAISSALHFSQVIPVRNSYTKLFCSSVLNLTELIGLRPDLSKLEKIIYFHENQLLYPVYEKKNREADKKKRNFHFGFGQILSCLTADRILFNSEYNMNSFLKSIDNFLKLIPSDSRPKNVSADIQSKCEVLYFPMIYPKTESLERCKPNILHIVWNHRWEHDKNPELFFRTLFRLKSDGFSFRLSVLGESYNEKPEIFYEAKQILSDEILNWGFLPSQSDYYKVLRNAHVVVSTAMQECFGISVLEAAHCGCHPVCPNDLAYPEIYPADCLYSTEGQLYKKLRNLCKFPNLAIQKRQSLRLDFDKYSWETLKNRYALFLT